MKIELTPDAAQWVQAELDARRFATPEEAIRHAVREAKINELRATLDAALARGGGLSLEEVTERANAHLDRLNQTPRDS